MKHRVAGRKLGRTSAHRLALLRNLATALFEKERIRTTLSKAKELRPFAERLVTLSKRETLHARRRVFRHIHDRSVVAKLFDTLSARYAQRPGGYTRILKLGPRRGDAAEMALIELVGAEPSTAARAPAKGKKARPAPKAAPEAPPAEEKKPVKGRAKKKAKAKGKAKPEDKAKPEEKTKTEEKVAAAPKWRRKKTEEGEKAPVKRKAASKGTARRPAKGRRSGSSSE